MKKNNKVSDVNSKKFTENVLDSKHKHKLDASDAKSSKFDYDDADTLKTLKTTKSKSSIVAKMTKMTDKDKNLWKQFFKFLMPVVYGLCGIVVILMIKFLILQSSYADIAGQNQQIKDLQQTFTLIANTNEAGITSIQNESDYGSQLYNGQQDSNYELVNEFFTKYLNWSSGEQYNSLRDDIQIYLLDGEGKPVYSDKNSFVQCFLPKQDETYDDQGHKTYEVDAERAQLTYQGMNLYKLKTAADESTYCAIVGIHSQSNETGPTGADRRVYVTFTIKNNKLYKLLASPISYGVH